MNWRIAHAWQRLAVLLRSVRFRLALWFVLILGMVLLLFSGFIYARLVPICASRLCAAWLSARTLRWRSCLSLAVQISPDAIPQILG